MRICPSTPPSSKPLAISLSCEVDIARHCYLTVSFAHRIKAVYRSLLHLSWIDKLVDNIKTLFVDLYGDQLKKPNTTIVECHGFDEYFDQQVRELEGSTSKGPAVVPEAALPREEPTLSGNLGDEPPPPPGLHYKGKADCNDFAPFSRLPHPFSFPIYFPSCTVQLTTALNYSHRSNAERRKLGRRALS